MKRKKWSEDEIEFLKQHMHLSDKQLALELERTIYSVKWRRKELGLFRKREDFWTEEEIDFLVANKDKSLKYLAEKLDKTISSIGKKRSRLGITNNEHGINVKYTMNMDFFKTWSNDMAYVLGFIYADGCISSSKFGHSTEIPSTDREIIEKINLAMDSTYPIKVEKGTRKKLYAIRIFRKEIYNDLVRLGVHERKSLTLQFPNIPDNYFWHFVRGYFDGDGSVRANNRGGLTIFIYSGGKDFLGTLHEKLNDRGITNSFRKHSKNGNLYELAILKAQREIFVSKMYENSNLFLKRKYDVFQKYFESRFIACLDCKNKVKKKSSSHKRCDECGIIHKKKRDRENSKIWWAKNKDRYKR